MTPGVVRSDATAAAQVWFRKGFKGTNAAKRAVNPTTVPIKEKESARWLDNLVAATRRRGDPARCVHAGDREADIFEMFHAAHTARAHVLVRTAVDRLAGRGQTTERNEPAPWAGARGAVRGGRLNRAAYPGVAWPAGRSSRGRTGDRFRKMRPERNDAGKIGVGDLSRLYRGLYFRAMGQGGR